MNKLWIMRAEESLVEHGWLNDRQPGKRNFTGLIKDMMGNKRGVKF